MFKKAQYRVAGDRGLLAEYGDTIDPEVNHKVRSMALVLEQDAPAGVVEVIPTYRSLLVVYDPALTDPEKLRNALLNLEKHLAQIKIPAPHTVEIPVCYGGDFGPDIQFVADCHNLSVEEVVRIHCQPQYPIYMVGFTPGFPFLGGLPETLHTPRLKTPRKLVPEGSVGIANNQTGIYPVASPGGWQLIGRTPLRLFVPERTNPFLFKAGDRIRFKPISAGDYHRLSDKESK